MAFSWKGHKDIWKGEGIYHLTFVVAERRRVLGELVALEFSRAYNRDVERLHNTNGKNKYTSELATTELSTFGYAVLEHLMQLPDRYSYVSTDNEPAIQICAKQFMPDHLHVVVWVRKDLGKSIRQVAQGFRIGIRKIAEEMGVWRMDDGHVFQIPFIRTLSRKGQKMRMIDYVHANPDDAWRRKMNPDMYVIRRNQHYAGLRFDCMGKARLLYYPDTQVVALSRSLSEEQINAEVQKALRRAERGVVTYCAAINDGEKAVTKAIRNAGYPLVVMMFDGFPPEGSEAARYFKPGGAYHKACGEGKLFLMAPMAENYMDSRLIELTDAELNMKAKVKGYSYQPLPHTSKRWRMIAGNVMLRMVSEG